MNKIKIVIIVRYSQSPNYVGIKSINILRNQNIRKVFLQEQYKTIFQALHDVFRAPIQSLKISDFVKKVENMSKEEPANWTVIRKEFQVI